MNELIFNLLLLSGSISLLLFAFVMRLSSQNKQLRRRHVKILALLEEKIITAKAA